MEFKKEFAYQFWEAVYGDEVLVLDCFGDYIYKEDFDNNVIKRQMPGKEELSYGWDIDFILPLSEGGEISVNNLEIMHCRNIREKSNKTVFTIKSKVYEIHKCKTSVEGYNGYGIKELKSQKRVDWKFILNKHF